MIDVKQKNKTNLKVYNKNPLSDLLNDLLAYKLITKPIKIIR